ncbi:MAG: transposase [Deltaproteobacteria bacterium]|nr:transposase [Deltaproteobacteria bacterium]
MADTAAYTAEIHHRRSIRLQGYDYAGAGAYFVTICAHDHNSLFGEIVDGKIVLNNMGQVVLACWNDLPHHYKNLELDFFTIMPNHVHGIMALLDTTFVGAGLKPAPTGKRHGLPEMVRALKTFSSKRINQIRKTPGMPVWQRNYYDHVIRDDDDLNRIREYVINNPANWQEDEENR